MPSGQAKTFSASLISSISDVAEREWDVCIPDSNPFVRHAYLATMEQEGVATQATGYTAQHLILRDSSGIVAGAVPLYLKDHSRAEFGADLGWSLPHNRAVGPYYPKLQSEPPYCPLPGPRLLMRPDLAGPALQDALVGALVDAVQQANVSSLHLAFLQPVEWQILAQAGLLCDFGVRFVWRNRGYKTFDDFLNDLKSNSRGMIRRERREFQGTGLVFDRIDGRSVTAEFIDTFFPLYKSTYSRYETDAPMTLSAFQRLRSEMAESLIFTVARLDGRIVAATMFMLGGQALYAMHWGASIEQRFLHFELTYYQGIEIAIECGCQKLDGGADGMHKVTRGLMASESLHAHWFRDKDFAQMLAKANPQRISAVQARLNELDKFSPYTPTPTE